MQPARAKTPLFQAETPPVFPHAIDSDEIDFCSMDHGTIDYESIVTEDDTPVDNLLSERHRTLLTSPLRAFWKPGRSFLAVSDVGLFYLPKKPPLVPDAMLSMDVSVPKGPDRFKKENKSYFLWRYRKPPEVVIEVVSNKEGGEKDRKFEMYAAIKIKYYVVYDPEHYILTGDPLEIYELKRKKYVRMKAPYFFPDIGLGLTLWEGTFEDFPAVYLRWCAPDGTLIPTAEDERRRADESDRRANEASRRANEASRRADEAGRRAEKLARMLREAGIDPDSQ